MKMILQTPLLYTTGRIMTPRPSKEGTEPERGLSSPQQLATSSVFPSNRHNLKVGHCCGLESPRSGWGRPRQEAHYMITVLFLSLLLSGWTLHAQPAASNLQDTNSVTRLPVVVVT